MKVQQPYRSLSNKVFLGTNSHNAVAVSVVRNEVNKSCLKCTVTFLSSFSRLFDITKLVTKSYTYVIMKLLPFNSFLVLFSVLAYYY